MLKSIATIARRPGRAVVILALALVTLALALTIGGAAPSTFVESTDANVRDDSAANPPYDWANKGTGAPNTCALSGAENLAGDGGLFNCGKFNGSTTPPTPPVYVGPGSASPNFVQANAFDVDPLSVDTDGCGTGDDVYTGTGGEKNGDRLNTETFSTSSVPNKDDLTNTYAIARRSESGGVITLFELFLGAERVVNNGDSHVDMEFLQAPLTTSGTCSGSFSGHRSEGDFIASIDYTQGGTLGGFSVHVWHCDPGGGTVPTGTICDPGRANQGFDPDALYEEVTITGNVFFVTNGTGSVPCGGWACRNADGTQTSTIAANELMEGGVDLLALGLTGCFSTFLPHTRSSQSFTATLKDFAGPIPFNVCHPSTTLTKSANKTLIHVGDSVTYSYTETNDGNVALFPPGTGPAPAPAPTAADRSKMVTDDTCSPVTFTGGDGNNNNILDPGEVWSFTCSKTFNTTGTFTNTATGHGLFNGADVTFCADPNSPPTGVICDQDERAQQTVKVISPSTSLTKSASPTTIHSGDTVTYTYRETNDGVGGADAALTGVSVTDPDCSPLVRGADDPGNNDTTLEVGETWVFTCSKTIVAAQSGSTPVTVTNTATAAATDALGFTVTFCADPGSPPLNTICDQQERASATVTVIHPSTSLTKSASPVTTVTYGYAETNDGDVPLTNPSVTDDQCGPASQVLKGDGIHNTGDTDNDGVLDPGETWNFTCTKVYTGTGTFTNVAIGSATDPLAFTVTFCAAPPNSTTICDAEETATRTVTVTVN